MPVSPLAQPVSALSTTAWSLPAPLCAEDAPTMSETLQ
jgi:hypothetical protein